MKIQEGVLDVMAMLAEKCPMLDVKYLEADDLIVAADGGFEVSDVMLLDTWHAFPQLRKELQLIPQFVRKAILLHDTSSFGKKDESISGHAGEVVDQGLYRGVEKIKGLWPAVELFLTETSDWILGERRKNCNGLTILARKEELPALALSE